MACTLKVISLRGQCIRSIGPTILLGTPLACGDKPKSPHAKMLKMTCLVHPVKVTSLGASLHRVCLMGTSALWGHFVPINTVLQNG